MAGDSGERVLVVDDEPCIRTVCRQALENSGYVVVDAPDGETALQELDRGAFGAAVLDIMLPDTDGLKLLREIKHRDESTVVVLITGFASLETAMDAVRLGAYEYVRKPFSAGDLVRIVDRGLEGRRLKGHNAELLDELRLANEQLTDQQDRIQARMRLATEDLTAFVELGRRLSEETSPEETLRSILEAGTQVVHARSAAVYQSDCGSGRLAGLLSVGLPTADVARVTLSRPGSLLTHVADQGLDRIENDLLAGPIAEDEHLGFLGVQSVLANPLVHGGDVVGVMAFYDHQEGAFPEHSPDLVRVLSGQAARVVAAMREDVTEGIDGDDDEFVDIAEML